MRIALLSRYINKHDRHRQFLFLVGVLSLNNSRFGDFVDSIYPIELQIKDTTDTDMSALYLDLHLQIDSEGWLRTKLYNKRDDFNLPIMNLPFICSNITHRYADCLLKNTSTKDNKYMLSIKNSSMLMISVSENILTSFQIISIYSIKTWFQSYCDTSYSRRGVNQMWILKNSQDLLEYIQ
jgi:hypothetical protein